MLLRDIRVFLALALLADSKGEGDTVMAKVIECAHQSQISVSRALERLAELELVRISWGIRKGPGAGFHFRINPRWLE